MRLIARHLTIAAGGLGLAWSLLATAQPAVATDGPALLAARALQMPVEGVRPDTLRDTFVERRGSAAHEAIDILAARGTPVHAVDDGVLVKLFNSKAGGLTIYQFDTAGQLAYYYAHLDRYAENLKQGTAIKRGELIGYVGSTGNASPGAPHLHFAVFRLGPEKHWWQGTAVNPFPALQKAP